jgi:hypothetical protein
VLEQIIQVCLFLLQRTFLGHWIQLFDDGIFYIENFSFETSISFSFEKRIYIPLPGVNERAAMFKIHLGTTTNHTVRDNEWMQLAQRSEQ